jgi:NMD protein affecting ribosome stability and mRNA decay
LTSKHRDEEQPAGDPAQANEHRVLLGDQQCPRCRKFFTMSYWSGDTLVQARCMSCDLKWPLPDVV